VGVLLFFMFIVRGLLLVQRFDLRGMCPIGKIYVLVFSLHNSYNGEEIKTV
jgi:hypothetical protein